MGRLYPARFRDSAIVGETMQIVLKGYPTVQLHRLFGRFDGIPSVQVPHNDLQHGPEHRDL